MKKILSKSLFCLFLLIATTGFSACSSDDDNSASGNGSAASAVAGKYLGTLKIDGGEDAGDHYEAMITIKDIGGDKIRISTDNFTATTKETAIDWLGDEAWINGVEALVLYSPTSNEKTIRVITKKTSENDVIFIFDGVRK